MNINAAIIYLFIIYLFYNYCIDFYVFQSIPLFPLQLNKWDGKLLQTAILQCRQCQSKLIVFNSDQLPIRLPLDELPTESRVAYIL